MRSFTISSALESSAAAVWARVSTAAGINEELAPWLRMTMPAAYADLRAPQVELGKRLFRSWILLFGLWPIDYDDLVLLSVEDGRGFHERSSMLSARVWEHRRSITDSGPGRCVLTDRIDFEPRFGLLGPVLWVVSRAVFRHRHRRLRQLYGSLAPLPEGT